MVRPLVVVSLLFLLAALALAQVDPDKLPTKTTEGNTNPEAISDTNAQLIWLLAAAPDLRDPSRDALAASALYQFLAFPNVGSEERTKLLGALNGFRSAYDSLVTDFNSRVPSVARDDVWKEYRDFRVKVNDLVGDTIRNLYTMSPDSAASLRSEVQRARDYISVSAYRSSADPDYANNPRTAATGFAYIQAAVSASAHAGDSDSIVRWVTVVMVGMVPGCPGKVFPTATIDGTYMEGAKLPPSQYIDFQRTQKTTSVRPAYFFAVKCAIPTPDQP
jgi:hypothetical protein